MRVWSHWKLDLDPLCSDSVSPLLSPRVHRGDWPTVNVAEGAQRMRKNDTCRLALVVFLSVLQFNSPLSVSDKLNYRGFKQTKERTPEKFGVLPTKMFISSVCSLMNSMWLLNFIL